ncbi:histidine kinase dimerization/phospho-acceptor domain-containing protein [Brevundimonas diminuta]|uniref:histidine kinase n=1 Tax=Brevundimonas vancanneytii TaxID=1325724 RepID=A0A4P1JYD8_9CAUL|nr:histidine kinase dimerization/phospho-acceptor domain-containing protein [Brevundimonas vancanneytii]VTO12176.1 Sensor protein CreC [Brevundimonas vancanneytii]
MINLVVQKARAFVRAHWPALRLRTILLSVLLFAAVLPGAGAVFLRVYENTLVRQTEAELIAQTVALSAAAETLWPGARVVVPTEAQRATPGYFRPEPASIDLRSDPVLPPRPVAQAAPAPPEPMALDAAARLAPIMEETSRITLASIVLMDRNGVVVRGLDRGGTWRDLPEVKTALSGAPATVLRRNAAYEPRYQMEWLSRASGLRIHHARPVVVNGRVEGVILTSRSPRALFKGVYQDRGKILFGVIVVFGLLSVLAVVVSRGIARPIEALRRVARDVTHGGGSVPPPPATAAIEIRDLYEDFGRMAEAVDRRSRYLRDFAAAVSHEFKTPLAGIQGAVELLQDHGDDMEPDQRRRFLGNIDSDARRLSDLVTRLLDLARADMARPEAGAAVDLRSVAARIADALKGGLTITVDLPAGLPKVAVPEASLEMALSILLENSRQVGAGEVLITAQVETDQIRMFVADDGPGVAEGDVERIFEPFFTTRRNEGGAGLGLSIARSLLRANHADLGLAGSRTGAMFEIALPRVSSVQASP